MLTACEDEQLREAYERTVAVGAGDQEDMTQEEYVHYGSRRWSRSARKRPATR